jgi:DNA polymerase III alpha subunit
MSFRFPRHCRRVHGLPANAPTARGKFSFITLEDEDGLINIVIRPEVYKTYRPIIRLEPFLIVEGIVEKKDGLINVKAQIFQSLRGTSNHRNGNPEKISR